MTHIVLKTASGSIFHNNMFLCSVRFYRIC